VATGNPPRSKPKPSKTAMRLDGRHRISTAARRKTAPLAKERTDESSITLDRDDEQLAKQ